MGGTSSSAERARRGVMSVLVAAVALALGLPLGGVDASGRQKDKRYSGHHRTIYVKAGGTGKGSRHHPLGSLVLVHARSHRGDRIVVLRSHRALNGGLQLRRRQSLIGAGPPVTRLKGSAAAPHLTNTTKALSGDAVRLANRNKVRNLRITGTRRGGIYGKNVSRARIKRNDISGHNTSCVEGFHIPSFNVPTLAPNAGIPISDGLKNGWAGIMVDATQGKSKLQIRGNRVHDADCGDGIDVRASGSASMRPTVVGNDVRKLRQGDGLSSLLAIGLQTREHSHMSARLSRNSQSTLGNKESSGFVTDGADSEGVFVNPSGPSSLRATISRNRYSNVGGHSGFSGNGLEFVSMGKGSRGLVSVRNSVFKASSGDVIEQLALGTDASLGLTLDHVTAKDSTGFAASGFGDTVVIPGNDADCLIAASGGARNSVNTVVKNGVLTGCANNGITFGSSVANGSGPSKSITMDVSDSTITGNHGGNLRIGNTSPLDHLSLRVRRTDLSDSQGKGSSPANVFAENLGTVGTAKIDLDAGNCFAGGLLAVSLVGFDATARNSWWGTPGGPAAGRVLAVGGALDSSSPLGAAPAAC